MMPLGAPQELKVLSTKRCLVPHEDKIVPVEATAATTKRKPPSSDLEVDSPKVSALA